MNWKTAYFGFDGRLSRRQWWLAIIPLLLASLVVSFLANPLAWFSETVARRGPNLAQTLFDIAFLIPETAVIVKRFNDRDWPRWLPYGYAIILLFFTVLDHNRMILRNDPPSFAEIVFLGSILAIMITIVIDNGFLRGTVGPNRYGPDPNDDASAADAEPGTNAERARRDRRHEAGRVP
jgi:uncharacterized membrane protein YhaH (DUF805 family)